MGEYPHLTRRKMIALGAAAMGAAWAQDDEATFSTGISVVNVFVTVRDKQGQIFKGLTKDDFVLEEDGHRQEIQYFASQSDLPLTLGVLVDVSGSMRDYIPRERKACYQFLDQVLRDEDQAFIFRFYQRAELVSYLNSSRAEMETGLRRLEDPPPKIAGNNLQGQFGMFFGTALYDAVALASDSIMKQQKGRKALILMTDGQDTGSSTTLNTAIEAAQRADTLIYALGFFDDVLQGRGGGGGGMVQIGKDVLKRLSSETGGRLFDVTTNAGHRLEDTFGLIQEDLRNQYSLGYEPGGTTTGYRKVKVSLKNKSGLVTTRTGYYTGAKKAAGKDPVGKDSAGKDSGK